MKLNAIQFIYAGILKYNFTITVTGNDSYKETVHWPNGNKRCELIVVNNFFHGTQLSWHENGVKQYVTEYYDGRSHGKALGWDRHGVMVQQVTFYHGIRQWDSIKTNET